MARQNSERASKRHLVRWNDEMDKKLLLTLQSVCNSEGIRLPWDKVGVLMGDHISDGAVVQHLAKVRQRMVSRGLSVPPPLRRGGGSINSTKTSTTASVKKSAMSKIKAEKGTKLVDENDEDGEGFDENIASDSDEDFGHAPSKRMKRKSNKKGRETKIKSEDSDEDGEDVSYQVGNKRKRGKNAAFTTKDKKEKTKDFRTKLKRMLKQKPLARTALTRPVRVKSSSADVNDSDDDVDLESDLDIIKDNEHKTVFKKKRYVAAGADFLLLEESEKSGQDEAQVGNADFPRKRRVTVFKFGNSERAKSLLKDLEPKDEAEDEGFESVFDYDTDDLKESANGVESDGANENDQDVESFYDSDSDDADENDQAPEEPIEDVPSTDAQLEFGLNAAGMNEPPNADNHQGTYEDVSVVPSIGSNFSGSNHIHGSSMTCNPQQGDSHFPYNSSFQQFNSLEPGYLESARQEGYFGGSAELNKDVNSGYIATSDPQKIEYALTDGSTPPRSIDTNWNFQPGFNNSYVPLADQHFTAAPETLGHSNHLPYSHTALGPQLADSNDMIPVLPRGMARSNKFHNEAPQNFGQLPIASYGQNTGYNSPGTSNQQEYFSGSQISLTSPLPVHVPQQANYPGVSTDNFSATTTNFNPTPWTMSPGLLDDSGDLIGAQLYENTPGVPYHEGPSDIQDDDLPFGDYLMNLDELDDVITAHFNGEPSF